MRIHVSCTCISVVTVACSYAKIDNTPNLMKRLLVFIGIAFALVHGQCVKITADSADIIDRSGTVVATAPRGSILFKFAGSSSSRLIVRYGRFIGTVNVEPGDVFESPCNEPNAPAAPLGDADSGVSGSESEPTPGPVTEPGPRPATEPGPKPAAGPGPKPVGSCGAYAGAPTLSIAGNGGTKFSVVKIRREDLSRPASFNLAPTATDNTMTVATACAWSRLKAAARAAGHRITINSGFRTLGRQQYFYNCHVTKRCNGGALAARPGTSNHGLGKALDLQLTGAAYNWMTKNARKFGFRRTVPSETWHWEFFP